MFQTVDAAGCLATQPLFQKIGILRDLHKREKMVKLVKLAKLLANARTINSRKRKKCIEKPNIR